MGQLIATTQATVDGVIDPVGEWVRPGGDHGEYSFERQQTLLDGELEQSVTRLKQQVDGDLFVHGSGEFAHALAERGLIDLYEVYLNPLVWGSGNVHVLGDRGTVWLELADVKRFDSGVVLLTYQQARKTSAARSEAARS